MIENHLEIPAAWCLDKDIISGYVSMEVAREIVESRIPEVNWITIKAFYGGDEFGETRTPAAAIRAKFQERLIKQREGV